MNTKPGSGIGRQIELPAETITIADENSFATTAVEEETRTIPAYINTPDVRIALPSGTFGQGYSIVNVMKVYDQDGNEVDIGGQGNFKVDLTEWPSDENQEILGVIYMNFVVANKSVEIGTPVIIEPAEKLG